MMTKQDAIIEVYKLVHDTPVDSTNHVLFEHELQRRFPRSTVTTSRITQLVVHANLENAKSPTSSRYVRVNQLREDALQLVERLHWERVSPKVQRTLYTWSESVGA